MSEEKRNTTPPPEDFSLEDILLEYATPREPLPPPAAPWPDAQALSAAELERKLAAEADAATLLQDPPPKPGGNGWSELLDLPVLRPQVPREPWDEAFLPLFNTPKKAPAASSPDTDAPELSTEERLAATPAQEAPSMEETTPEGASAEAPGETPDASTQPDGTPETTSGASTAEAAAATSDTSPDADGAADEAPEASTTDDDTAPAPEDAGEGEPIAPQGEETPDEGDGEPTGDEDTSPTHETAEGEDAPPTDEAPAGDDQAAPRQTAAKAKGDGPDDIPFQSQKVLEFGAAILGKIRGAKKEPVAKTHRTPHPDRPPAEDTSPRDLANQYSKGLRQARGRCMRVLLLGVLLLYPALVFTLSFPAPSFLQDIRVLTGVSVALFALALFFARHLLWEALQSLPARRVGMPTITLLAVVWVLVDAVTMLTGFRAQTLPLFAPITFILGLQMMGRYWDRLCKRIACRTASLAAEPYAVTLDYDQWEGDPSFCKHEVGSIPGFGSQVQSPDGAQERFGKFAPVAILICLVLGVVSTVAHHQPTLVFWAMSAYFAGASTLAGCLCYSLPCLSLSRRLSHLGAALAGWAGIEDTRDGDTILLEDGDLFPPGSIKLQSFQVFDDLAPARVISCAATLIRASGSGLDSLFHNLIRAEDGQYLDNLTNFATHPNGITGTLLGSEVFVGNADFMDEMGVPVEEGFRVKGAVFCAFDRRLGGLFLLEYTLHRSIPTGVDALITSKIAPVLLLRDFNLMPAMLRQRFKLPWDKMVFATPSQRAKLPDAPSDRVLVAVLCREGMEPFAAAAAGAQRLAFATRVNSLFTCLSSVVGIVLTFLLVSAGSLTALSPISLTVFLFLWLIPVALLSGWVNQY